MSTSPCSSRPGRARARPLRSPSALRMASRKSRDRSSAMSTGCSPSRLPTRRRESSSAACAPSYARRGSTRSPSRSMPPGSRPFTRCVAACCFRMPSTSASIQVQICLPRTKRRHFPPSRSMRCCGITRTMRASSCFSTISVSRARRISSAAYPSCSCSHRAAGMTSIWGQLLRRPALSPVGCRGFSPRIRERLPSSTSSGFPRAR